MASIDSYATLFAGRERLDLTAVSGKYGYAPSSLRPRTGYQPGIELLVPGK